MCDTTASTSCTDPGLPDGAYTYTVVAEYRTFSASADSNVVTVGADDKAPAPHADVASDATARTTTTTTVGGAAGNAAGDPSTVPAKIQDGTDTAGSGIAGSGTADTGTAGKAPPVPPIRRRRHR